MLYNLFSLIYYTSLLILFPAILTILGGLFDYKNRSEGNFRYDLPSTISFIVGILIDVYILFSLPRLLVCIVLFTYTWITYQYIEKIKIRFNKCLNTNNITDNHILIIMVISALFSANLAYELVY
jgi:hypothetical protein